MYRSVNIRNFRGLETLEIQDCRKFNLILGGNNAGKTTILESLFLLAGVANPILLNTITNLRSDSIRNNEFFRNFFYKANLDLPINFSATLTNNHKMSLEIVPKYKTKFGNIIDFNKQKNTGIISAGGEVAIAGIKLTSLNYNTNIKNVVSLELDINGTPVVTPSLSTIQLPRFLGTFIYPSSSMPSQQSISKMIIEKKEEKILKVLKKVEPNLKRIVLGEHGVPYCDMEGFDHMIPLSSLGEGTKRIFKILLDVGVTPNMVLFIDELDIGLHPSNQLLLLEGLINMAIEFDVQVFATTHSPFFLSELNNYILASNVSKNKKEKVIEIMPDIGFEKSMLKVFYITDDKKVKSFDSDQILDMDEFSSVSEEIMNKFNQLINLED